MKKFKIQICLLGYQRYLDKIEKLQNYSSKLFEVTNCIVIKQLPPCDHEWGYSDNCINQLLTSSNIDNSNVELCLCFIDNPIEYNYFTRDLSEFDSKTVLCSFYQVETIFDEQNIDIFNYIHGIILNDLNSLFRSGTNSLSTAVDSILAIQEGHKLGTPYFIAISFFNPHISNRQFLVSSCRK